MHIDLGLLTDASHSGEAYTTPMSSREADRILQEENLDMVYILKEIRELDALVDRYLVKRDLDILASRYPETASYAYRMYGLEAWNVTNNMKAMFERFKNFFKRIFNYISRFAVLRIKAATNTVKAYSEHISNPDNTDKVDKVASSYDVKDIRVETARIVLDKAKAYYEETSKQIEAVKNTNENNLSTDGDDVEKLFGELPAAEDYRKAVEQLDKESPNDQETKGEMAVTAKEGGWLDKEKIAGLLKTLDGSQQTFLNLKRLQIACNSLIADLEKTDQPAAEKQSDNTEAKGQAETKKTINGKKIEFLRKFSKEILTGVVRTIVNTSTTCGKKCQTLDKALTGKPETEKPEK